MQPNNLIKIKVPQNERNNNENRIEIKQLSSQIFQLESNLDFCHLLSDFSIKKSIQ